MSETIATRTNIAARIRNAARLLVKASLESSLEAKNDAAVDIGALTAGIDPNTINRSSDEYIFGVAEALASTLSTISEATPDRLTIDYLAEKPNAKLLAKIASKPGITYREIHLDGSQEEQLIVSGRLDMMNRHLSLIEPAIPPEDEEGHAWQLTPWGTQTYLQMLPQIAESAGIEPMIHGLRGILEKKRDQTKP